MCVYMCACACACMSIYSTLYTLCINMAHVAYIIVTVRYRTQVMFSVELPYRQSANSHMGKHSIPGSVHRHFTMSSWTPHEEFADTS